MCWLLELKRQSFHLYVTVHFFLVSLRFFPIILNNIFTHTTTFKNYFIIFLGSYLYIYIMFNIECTCINKTNTFHVHVRIAIIYLCTCIIRYALLQRTKFSKCVDLVPNLTHFKKCFQSA